MSNHDAPVCAPVSPANSAGLTLQQLLQYRLGLVLGLDERNQFVVLHEEYPGIHGPYLCDARESTSSIRFSVHRQAHCHAGKQAGAALMADHSANAGITVIPSAHGDDAPPHGRPGRRATRAGGAEGRSMQQVAVAALDDYLLRAEDDELTDRLTAQGAERFADLLRRLGE